MASSSQAHTPDKGIPGHFFRIGTSSMLEATSRERNFFHELLHGDTGCPLPQSILRAGILFTYSEGWSYAGQAAR